MHFFALRQCGFEKHLVRSFRSESFLAVQNIHFAEKQKWKFAYISDNRENFTRGRDRV